jgi:hypothetical protein
MTGRAQPVCPESWDVLENWILNEFLERVARRNRATACLLAEAVGASDEEVNLLNLAMTSRSEAICETVLAGVIDEVVRNYSGPQVLPA